MKRTLIIILILISNILIGQNDSLWEKNGTEIWYGDPNEEVGTYGFTLPIIKIPDTNYYYDVGGDMYHMPKYEVDLNTDEAINTLIEYYQAYKSDSTFISIDRYPFGAIHYHPNDTRVLEPYKYCTDRHTYEAWRRNDPNSLKAFMDYLDKSK